MINWKILKLTHDKEKHKIALTENTAPLQKR